MKQIIIDYVEKVQFKSLKFNEDFYYGVKYCSEVHSKAFITRTDYNSGAFTTRCINELSNGNSFCRILKNPNFKTFVQCLLDDGCDVFVFETKKEFLEWLMK